MDWQKHLLIHPRQVPIFFWLNFTRHRLDRSAIPDRSMRNLYALHRRLSNRMHLSDRTIDARRCISYLTIELKDGIPAELRSFPSATGFSGATFANGLSVESFCRLRRRSGFSPRDNIPHPNLSATLELTSEEFNRKFKKQSDQRTKLEAICEMSLLHWVFQARDALPPLKKALTQS